METDELTQNGTMKVMNYRIDMGNEFRTVGAANVKESLQFADLKNRIVSRFLS